MITVQQNVNNGIYISGRSFDELKWAEIVSLYGTRISLNGKCTVRELASEAKVSLATAKKAIDCYNDGYDYPLKEKREKAIVGSKR